MAWENSKRGEFTANARWRRVRAAVLERDGHRCVVSDCPTPTDRLNVDHIVNAKSGGAPYDPANCQTLCHDHHGAKTSAEGNAARWRYRSARPVEKHPGLK